MHKETRLNIILVGHTGAGKSSLINSIYSISRGRIVDIASSKSDDLPGVQTHHVIYLTFFILQNVMDYVNNVLITEIYIYDS